MNLDKNKSLKVLYFSLMLTAIVGFLHVVALENDFYFFYWWFDLMMHFLGGIGIAAGFLWLYFFSGILENPPTDKKIIFLILLVVFLIISISWEVFEFFTEKTFRQPNFVSDTISDVIIGLIGIYAAFKYFFFNFLKS